MELHCPFCGIRAVSEFTFRSLAPERGGQSAWALVYERVNDPNYSREYWQHVAGCRAWLLVTRNPSSDCVYHVRLLADEG